jgi:hypothetical protein
MKTRLLSRLCLLGAFAVSALAAEPAAAPVHATTITKSAIKIGNGSFALVKGTKLEVLGREGDNLIVKFRSMQGKIPLAETDFNPDTELPKAAPTPVTPATAAKAPAKPADPVTPAAAVAAKAVAPATTPPALSVDGKPATNYGKAVQKAKQVSEANKSTHVDPTKDIMDEQPK